MNVMKSKRYILALALHRAPHLRTDEKRRVLDSVDDERDLSLLSLRGLEEIIGRSLTGKRWSPDELLALAAEDAEYLERSGSAYLHYDDPAYPDILRETSRPPFGLFYRGSISLLKAPAVAVVGTRCPTGLGLSAAVSLARGLSVEGFTVVSGLARGIDAAAHRGALSARGSGSSVSTCAVLPCGIDRIYPPANRGLASAILEGGGLLLSEYPPGEDLRTYRFPERNRIIAGLARACVVVEAPSKSGALITADHALDEGRDVWVPRSCLGSPRAAGIDRLAMEGALIAESALDIVEDLARSGVVNLRRPTVGRGGLPGSTAPRRCKDSGGAEGYVHRYESEGRRLAALLEEELDF
jgi:DNA processing protein